MTKALFICLLIIITNNSKAELQISDDLQAKLDACKTKSTNEMLANESGSKDPGTITKSVDVILRRCATVMSVKTLADALNEPNFPPNKEVEKLMNDLITQREVADVVGIYTAAVDEVFDTRTAELLAQHLWQIYIDYRPKTFKIMLEVQLHLYWKFVHSEDINDLYLFNVAHYLRKIKENSIFESLETKLMRAINRAIANLPSSLQYLQFKSKLCLRNNAYSEHLYTGSFYHAIDSSRRKVYSWYNGGEPVSTPGDWVPSIAEVSSKPLQLKITLKSNDFDRYLDLALIPSLSSLHVLTAVAVYKAPETSEWSVQLIDNKLVFRQQEFVMCASPTIYDTNYRRFIYGFSDTQHNSSTESCQWIAEQCPY